MKAVRETIAVVYSAATMRWCQSKSWWKTREGTVWEFDKPRQSKLHPTMKPLQLIAYPMRMSSQENGIVIDLFGGSGSTLITAEQLNRICYTCELDPKYASAIVRRYVALVHSTENVTCIRDGKEIPCLELYQPTEADLSYQDASVNGDE